jgi:hypothetical protein
MENDIQEFAQAVIVQGLIFTGIFYGAYFAALYAVISNSFGRIGEWRTRLRELDCELSCDRIHMEDGSEVAHLTAVLSTKEHFRLTTFLNHHSAVERAARRLQAMDQKLKFFAVCIIIGFLFASVIKSPMIWGLKPIDEAATNLDALIIAAGTVMFIGLFSIPQVRDWNALDNAFKRRSDQRKK